MYLHRLAILALLALSACTTAWWVESADEEVADVLAEKRAAFDRFRAEELRTPEPRAEEEEQAPAVALDLADVPREVGLAEALAVATRRNRNYLAEKESLYLAALSLTSVRNDFSVLFSGTVSALLSDTDSSPHTNANSLTLGASRILPTGGRVSVTGRTTVEGGGPGLGYGPSSSVTVSLDQPLLSDAGYETSHEALTQAERNVVYAIRDFELFREDFTIDIAERYYSLVRQIQEIGNAERNLEARQFLVSQSEAKFAVGLATEVDKLRASREYLRAQTDLLSLKESFQLAVDRFKIQLGLPTSFPLEIRYQEPEYRDVGVALQSAVEAALHNRLDLLTARDRLEDSERGLRIQLNRLLPDLDFGADYTRSEPFRDRFGSLNLRDESWTIGLTLNLPLERTSERNAVRRAMIDRDRSRRSLSQQEDSIILEVRGSVRQIRRAEASLKIRKEEIHAAEKEARAAQIRFEAGEMDNRNVTDAQNAVLRAQNAYIQDLVEYEVARVQLLRDVGILFIDEEGMWVEP